MRIIRFLDCEGRILLGEDRRDGTAAILIEPEAILGVDPIASTLPLLRGNRTLVADDDENMRRIMSTVLENLGCECIIAADGAEAMRVIENEELDLVVSDIRMPHHDGYEIFSASRALNADMPVLLVTGFGYDPTHTLVRTSREGHSTVLYKPFSPQQLREAVCSAVHETLSAEDGFLATNDSVMVQSILPPLEPGQVVMAGGQLPGADRAEAGGAPTALSVMIEPAGIVCGPGRDIPVSGVDETEVEARAELAVVIGARAEDVAEAEALEHILGVTCANRLMARSVSGWGTGPTAESFTADSVFCCLGPALLTPEDLKKKGEETLIAIDVDGVPAGARKIQNVRRALARLVHQLSRRLVLEPGMTILAGEVLVGDRSSELSVMLRAGQSITVDITGIGSLTTTIEMNPAPAEADGDGDGKNP